MNWRLEHVVAAIALPLMFGGLALFLAGMPFGLWIAAAGIGVTFVPLVGALVMVLIETLRR